MMAARGKHARGIDVVLREIGHELSVAGLAKLVVYEPSKRQFLEAPKCWLSDSRMYQPETWPDVQNAPRRRFYRTPLLGAFRNSPLHPVQIAPNETVVSLGRPEILWRCMVDQPDLHHVVMIHDLTRAMGGFGQPKRLIGFHARLAQKICRTANRVLVPSNMTAGNLQKMTGLTAEVLVLARSFRKVPDSAMSLPKSPYVLYVGATNSWKNCNNLLAAAQHPQSPRLVLAGNIRMEVKPPTVKINSPDQNSLQALYEGSVGLIQPSLSEGFSLPLGEALSFGKPVAIEKGLAPLMPGTSAAPIYFDGQDVSDISRAMHALCHAGPSWLNQTRSWRDVALDLVELCKTEKARLPTS